MERNNEIKRRQNEKKGKRRRVIHDDESFEDILSI